MTKTWVLGDIVALMGWQLLETPALDFFLFHEIMNACIV